MELMSDSVLQSYKLCIAVACSGVRAGKQTATKGKQSPGYHGTRMVSTRTWSGPCCACVCHVGFFADDTHPCLHVQKTKTGCGGGGRALRKPLCSVSTASFPVIFVHVNSCSLSVLCFLPWACAPSPLKYFTLKVPTRKPTIGFLVSQDHQI